MRTSQHSFIAATIASAVVALSGFAQSDIRPPVSGNLYDPAVKEIRAVAGIPGAALLRPALDTGGGISAAAVLPDSDRAIVVDTDSGEPWLIEWTGGSVRSESLPGAPRNPAQVVLSGLGSTVAVRSSEEPAVFIYRIAEVPRPELLRRLDIPSDMSVLAVTDDASAVLISGDLSASVRTNSGELFAFPAGGVKAGAFRPGTNETATVDAGGNVWLHSTTTSRLLADGHPGKSAGLAFSRDGQYLIVGRSGTSTLSTFDLKEDSVTESPNTCAPAQIRRMAGVALFQICSPSDGAGRMLELNAFRRRLVVVPPDADQ
jgi:hypothetical protein